MNNYFYYRMTFLLILFSSCSEKIPLSEVNFVNNELNFELSVNGFISNEKRQCKITLRKPVPISEQIEIVPINDANVFLMHLNEIYSFKLDSNGVYSSFDSIVGVPGQSYKLEINYNGKTYTAEEKIPNEPNDEFNIPITRVIDSYYQVNDNYIAYSIPIHNFGYTKTNGWVINQVTLYNNTNPDSYFNFHNFSFYTHKGNLPQGIFPIIKGYVGSECFPTDSIEIIKGEISDQYNKYLLDKFNETAWQGGLFSTYPGNVSTNLSEGAIGYFYAINLKRKRFIIKDFIN